MAKWRQIIEELKSWADESPRLVAVLDKIELEDEVPLIEEATMEFDVSCVEEILEELHVEKEAAMEEEVSR